MHVNLGIWSRLTRTVVFLVAVSAVLAVALWYLPLIRQNEAMRKEILRLEGEIRLEENRGRRLESAIQAVRTDPKAVERLAREKLGYARPGETVILFEPPERNAPVHSAGTSRDTAP